MHPSSSSHPPNTSNLGTSTPTEEQVEAEFWRLMGGGSALREGEEKEEKGGGKKEKGRSRAPEEVKVEYGSEIDTGVYGSAFPLPAPLRANTPTHAGGAAPLKLTYKEKERNRYAFPPTHPPLLGVQQLIRTAFFSTTHPLSSQPPPSSPLSPQPPTHPPTHPPIQYRVYERSGWNVNNLPIATGSMLHHLDVPVTGVVVPWLYVVRRPTHPPTHVLTRPSTHPPTHPHKTGHGALCLLLARRGSLPLLGQLPAQRPRPQGKGRKTSHPPTHPPTILFNPAFFSSIHPPTPQFIENIQHIHPSIHPPTHLPSSPGLVRHPRGARRYL